MRRTLLDSLFFKLQMLLARPHRPGPAIGPSGAAAGGT
jgi:hypothetical protein